MSDRSTRLETNTQTRKSFDSDREAAGKPVTITAGEARQAEIIFDTKKKKVRYLIAVAFAMIGLVITYFLAAG